MHKTLTVPLDILLVLWGHMFLNRAVLVESTVQSAMGANTISAVEHLNRGAGHAHIYFLPDVLKWHRVVHAIHGNVVVGANRSNLPDSQFVGMCRQWAKERLFFGKSCSPAAVPLLKWFVVKALQAIPNGLIQLLQ